MTDLVNTIKELGIENELYMDIYVSCDTQLTIGIITESLLFHDCYNQDNLHPDPSLVEKAYEDGRDADHFRHTNGLLVDVIETTMEELLMAKKIFGDKGFPAQTMMRLYKPTGTSVDKILEELRKAFHEFQQNIAITDPAHTKAYVDHATQYF